MAVRVLLVLTAVAVLYGCGQASSPAEKQEKQAGVEEAQPKTVTPKPDQGEETTTAVAGNTPAAGQQKEKPTGGAQQQEGEGAHDKRLKIAFVSGNAVTANSEGASFEPDLCSALEMEGVRCTLMKMYAIKADGTDLTQLTKATAHEYGLGTRISDGRKVTIDWQDSTRISDISYVSGYSPDGTKKVFARQTQVTGRTDNQDIYVANADGTNETRITTSPADEPSAAWSPDGKKIVFARESMNQADVYLTNPNGTEQKRLIRLGGDFVGGLTWSPDGAKIAFLSMPDYVYPEVYVMNSDGTNLSRLTDNSEAEAGAEQLLFSPDSAKIAFVRRDISGYAIYVINVDGTGLRRVTNSETWEGIVSWIPLP